MKTICKYFFKNVWGAFKSETVNCHEQISVLWAIKLSVLSTSDPFEKTGEMTKAGAQSNPP